MPLSQEPAFLDRLSVEWALGTTRSVRRHLELARAVPRATVLECVDVAVQAPRGANGEGWRFVLIDDPEPRQALANLYREALYAVVRDGRIELKPTQRVLAENLHRVPMLILVCAIGLPPATVSGQVAFYGSILPAAWSLMIALRARGLGSTWTTLLSARQQEVADLLGIPDAVTQTVMLPVAYAPAARLRPAVRQHACHVTYLNRWGAGVPD